MATKLVVRTLPFPLAIFTANRFFKKPFLLLPKPSHPSLFSTISSSPALSFDHDFTYGPSLKKGKNPSQSLPTQPPLNFPNTPKQAEETEEGVIDKESFTRVFDIAAIRVPAEECFTLENKLRGHLLNWPRVRNVARVPGDEMEDRFKSILRENNVGGDKGENLESLDRRVYGKAEGDGGEYLSPVLYRDELAKSFNSRGYLNFKNLAKMSRPEKRKKKVKEGEGSEGGKRSGKSDFAKVEVVGDGNDEENDMAGLLGEEFSGGRWRGSTRLLLLDERYCDRGVDELPEAIKALLKENVSQSRTFVLVKCKLTLFYNYWQMNEILEGLLPQGITIPTAYEIVGHIAHLNLKDEHLPYKKLIAQVILDKNNQKIKTVVNKTDAIQNDYRTMQLEVLAGNHSLQTTILENGIRFHIDLASVYWSSRLATERRRLLSLFTGNDVVCDVFAGVGPIAIAAAKKVKRVYANDLNPTAKEYLERNTILNKLERKIKVFNMDGRRFINTLFASDRANYITQVVMNLPNDAAEFLDVFIGIFRKRPRKNGAHMPMIHVYGFSKAQDPEFDFHQRIRIALMESAVEVQMHRVCLVAPGKWMLCASFTLSESVAYARQPVESVAQLKVHSVNQGHAHDIQDTAMFTTPSAKHDYAVCTNVGKRRAIDRDQSCLEHVLPSQ